LSAIVFQNKNMSNFNTVDIRMSGLFNYLGSTQKWRIWWLWMGKNAEGIVG